MDNDQLNQALCQFLNRSPTQFHAVSVMGAKLEKHGFQLLNEQDEWGVLSPGDYYVTRNGSSIIAFTLPALDLATSGFHMVAAHTDSPCLKVKPQPVKQYHNLLQLGVEVYGGALLNPWFDRDLSMAGRVTYTDHKQHIDSVLIDFNRAIASIPSLAIHLDRDANNNRKINPQQHLPPILLNIDAGDSYDFRAILKKQITTKHPGLAIDKVLDFEISLYDSQPATVTGLHGDFISSARLDNLLSCYVAMQALITTGSKRPNLLVCNDHEEVGSVSASGAQGSFLQSVLLRLCLATQQQQQMFQRSMIISVDNAHAVHPNYADRHDAEHGPRLNSGPVIKTNFNQRYVTNSETSAYFRQLCQLKNIPVQDFVNRTDIACGSTVGPIIASNLGVKALDIGVPTLAMHSIRELAGSQDTLMLHRALSQFFIDQ